MKKKMLLSLTAVFVLSFSYCLGYWNGFAHARRGVPVVVSRDMGDSPRSPGEAEYEPYFSRQNLPPDRVK
jgi:hypothetical protein